MARRAVLVACTVSILPLAGAFPRLPAAAAADPPWLLHAKQYPGGLSAGVRQVAFQIESGSPSFALPPVPAGRLDPTIHRFERADERRLRPPYATE